MGRDKSDESIQEEKNLTGKIQYMEYELQILEDKYLLSGSAGLINQCFLHQYRCSQQHFTFMKKIKFRFKIHMPWLKKDFTFHRKNYLQYYQKGFSGFLNAWVLASLG